jgi:hypothetical protein
MSDKTVTVAFQLRVPKEVHKTDVLILVSTALRREIATHEKDDPLSQTRLHRERIEVFM